MRHRFHVVVSLSMWCLFGYYWNVVLGREVSDETIRAMGILVAGVIVGLVVTLLWIRHNLRLARKFEGRRQGFRNADAPLLTEDTIGRPVNHPGLDALRAASCVDITADETGKTYVVGDGEDGS